MATRPINLFYCYAREDQDLRKELEKQLALLRRQGLITDWYDGKILPGDPWELEIKDQLNRSHIILLLVSPDFIASDFCYSTEMEQAIERHRKKEARVIPVLLRPADCTDAPFSSLQMLPSNAKPVTSWTDRGEAFKDVAIGIRLVVAELLRPGAPPPTPPPPERHPTRRQLIVTGVGLAGVTILGVVRLLLSSTRPSVPSHPYAPTPSTATPTPQRKGKLTDSSAPLFYVYDHYDPRGFMGDIGDIKKEEKPDDRLVRFIYEAQGRGPHEWDLKYIEGRLNPDPCKFAGIMFLDGNWGKDPGAGFDLRGRPVIQWEARSLNGSVYVQFVAGGVTWVWNDKTGEKVDAPYPDSMPSIRLRKPQLTQTWQTLTYDLRSYNLSSPPDSYLGYVIGAFGWLIPLDSNGVQLTTTGSARPETFIIEVKNVVYRRP